MGRLDVLDGLADFRLVLHPHSGGENFFALLSQEVLDVPGDPSAFAPDEETVGLLDVLHCCR